MVAPIAGSAIASSAITSGFEVRPYVEPPQVRFTRNLLGAYACEPVVALLTIEHEDLDQTIRVTNNGADLDSNGETFQHFPFDIEFPGDGENEPVARLTIANVDRLIGDAIDAITTPATVGMNVVLTSSPDVLQKDWSFFELRNVTRTALEITGDIVIRQYASEPYPNIMVRESNFQNLAR